MPSLLLATPLAAGAVAAEEVSVKVSQGAAFTGSSSRGERTDTFEFETAFPHRLIRSVRNDGGSLHRALSRRRQYREEDAPGDERLLWLHATR
jgi:hypothetical protein